METEFIKFDPEKIMEVSERLRQQHKRLTTCAGNIKRKAESLQGSWQSDSYAEYIKKIKEADEQSGEAAKILLALSQVLASASGLYKTGATKVNDKASSLPISGVFNS